MSSPLDAAADEVPSLVETDLTLVDGRTFAISDRRGDMRGPTHGVVHDDRRHLSMFVVEVEDGTLEPLAATTPSALTAVTISRLQSTGGEPSSCLLVRRRVLTDGLREDIEIRETGRDPRAVTVRATLRADFAHVFDVKAGRHAATAPFEPIANGCEARDDAVASATRVFWSIPPSDGPTSDGVVTWRLRVPARGQMDLQLLVQPVVDGVPVDLTLLEHSAAFAATRIDQDATWRRSTPHVSSVDARVSRCVDRAIADLAALRIIDRSHPARVLVAAGAPWFMTLFGRDSLLVSWMTLGFAPSLAPGVLSALADLQGRHDDPATLEEPGKILHELRRRGGDGPFAERNRYYGTVDATALFVGLAAEAFRWGALDLDAVTALREPLRAALDWLLRAGDANGAGFVDYRPHAGGLTNQGWKDSWDGVNLPDGRLPEPPIALAEVQGYTFAALRGAAEIAAHLDLGHDAETLARRADRLADAFNERYWNPAGWFAVGLDGQGRRIDALTTNPGHAIWAGIADPGHADRHLDCLMADEMWTGWGIRTLATTMGAYDPLSYHNGSVWPHDTAICAAGAARYGRWDIVDRIMDGALDTAVHFDGRPPELFAGFSRGDIPSPVHYPASCSPQAWASASILHLVTTALGLTATPDGLRSTRTDVSGLPDLTLEGLTGPTGHVDIAVRDGHLSIMPEPRAEHSDHR